MTLTTFTAGTPAVATEVNDNFDQCYDVPFNEFAHSGVYCARGGLLKFADTVWISSDQRSTDSGATWSGMSTNLNDYIIATFEGSANGCAIISSSNTTKYTTNSGSTWSNGTGPTNMTACRAISMASSTVAVACGTASSLRSIWYSSNGGNTWTQASTGPTVVTLAVAMATTSIGFAVDTSGNIWRTADGGVNWTDTTINVDSGADNTVIHCYSTDVVFIGQVPTSTLYVYKYVHSTLTRTTVVQFPNVTVAYDGMLNFVQTADNNVFLPLVASSQQYHGTIWLYRMNNSSAVASKIVGMLTTTKRGLWTASTTVDYMLHGCIIVGDYLYYTNGYNITKIGIRNQ